MKQYLDCIIPAMTYRLFLLCIIGWLLSTCTTPRTVWKSDTSAPLPYNKIMVAVILNEKNDSIRAGFEQIVAYRLQKIGYHAVASSSEFGPGKLSRLSEEATYLSLCDNGIDAVLTFAEVDRSARPSIKKGIGKNYTQLFYYERIWNYRKVRDNSSSNIVSRSLEWECILFDLVSLQTQAVLRIGEVNTGRNSGMAHLADKFIEKMISVKALGKINKPSINPKPF